MARQTLNEAIAFLAVANASRFTRAAARLGVSRSALNPTFVGWKSGLVCGY